MNAAFSIIIPIYNSADTLEKCINSALGQTMSAIEVIAVNDASTDESQSLLEQMAKNDDRLTVLSLKENSGALVARKLGVSKATGQYTLFLDSDDAFTDDACEQLWNVLSENDVDILHFQMLIRNMKNVDDSDIDAIERFTEPHCETIEGKGVFFDCFAEGKHGWNLAGKAFKTQICKLGHEAIDDYRILRGEDALEYFAISYFAQSYMGIKESRYYCYSYGSGADGQLNISLDAFRNMCSSHLAADAMEEFLSSQNAPNEYFKAQQATALKLAGHSVRQFMLKIPDEEKPLAYNILLDEWGDYYGICALAARYWDNPGHAARIISGTPAIGNAKPSIRTIGTYYHHYTGGGTENVQRYLIKLWRSMGYNVIVFTDNEPDGIISSEATKWILLPESVRCTKATFPDRASMLCDAINQENIDLFVYHYFDSKTLLWEMLLLKQNHIPTVVYHHNSFSYLLHKSRISFSDFPYIYAMAEKFIALSPVDAHFFSQFCSNVTPLPSPLDYRFSKSAPKLVPEKNILYLGRIAPDKHTELAIKVFEKAASIDKDAHLTVVGGSGDEQYVNKIKSLIDDSRFSGRITYVGWDDDAERHYRNSRVMIMTSDIEGYPLTLVECGSLGVPVVMFDLPYLWIAQNNPGIISVPFGDIAGAAQHIIDILNDDMIYKRMSHSAQHASENIISFDHESAWRRIIEEMTNCKLQDGLLPSQSQENEIMWKTMLDANRRIISYWRGRTKQLEKKAETAQRKLEKEREKNKKLKKTLDWRLGHSALGIARAAKRLFKK